MSDLFSQDKDVAELEAIRAFEHQIGAGGIEAFRIAAGNEEFLKFCVGRDAPIYRYAIRETQKALPASNPFRGSLSLELRRQDRFPESLEATVLLSLLARSTRAVAENDPGTGFSIPYVPFQNHEDYQLAQAATHVVVGRRGVGKSTLIRRATEILRASQKVVVVIDSQPYATVSKDEVSRELLEDVVEGILESSAKMAQTMQKQIDLRDLQQIRDDLASGERKPEQLVPSIKRCLKSITSGLQTDVFVFLDDFHVVQWDDQPRLLHLIHGVLKGARGWLKVAGIRSLLNYYSPATREGLQIPGDAQLISLDLTLVNPVAAQSHLQAILEGFLQAVGYSLSTSVIPDRAFQRLAWANAGVPRDFLQMFAKSVEHARRNKHAAVTVSDVNIAIGESGQGKMDELTQDARNAEGDLRRMLTALEDFCLDEKGINAFLLSSEESKERKLTHILNDLRLVHLISQSITPDRAGKRFEAYILDYSLFTGFRRRQGIKEMIPKEGQFKASELRSLPKVTGGFLAGQVEAQQV
ncbi:ATP-binding protein [Bradyrhizobium sp. dw_78]|uniref:ATP-binding protein n=1 Tax=Bradyrhizobium sp. dw_78 TaxID=2719793 RepID=UPI001BD236D5|nr:ATP-binding protein [Bradyrhizobium sp. dw_78]